MKIALLNDGRAPFARGGAESVVGALGEAYRTLGHRTIEVATIRRGAAAPTAPDRLHLIESDYHARWRAYRGLYNPQTVPRLARILGEERPDVVHAHNLHTHLSYAALVVAARLGIPVVLTLHDGMSLHYGKIPLKGGAGSPPTLPTPGEVWWSQLRGWRLRYFPARNALIRWFLRRYPGRVVAVSHALGDLLRRYRVRCDGVMHNGVPVDFWAREPDPAAVAAARSRWGLAASDRLAVWGGRLGRLKGGETVARSVSLAVDRRPEVRLLVAGEPATYLRELLGSCSPAVRGRLVYTGWLSPEEMRVLYRLADAVLCPSVCFDAFPTLCLEALAAGVPVLATSVGGAAEIVEDGLSGRLLDPFDPPRWAEALLDLVDHPEKSRAFGDAGRQRVARHFDVRAVARGYVTMFGALASAPGHPAEAGSRAP